MTIQETNAAGERIRVKMFGLYNAQSLAKELEVHPNTISNIIKGERDNKPYFINIVDLMNICRLFKTTPDYILLGKEPKNDETTKRKLELCRVENTHLKREVAALKDHVQTLKSLKS
tara:strand:+ start:213 stop:563 length:351 start_codon:yes stop_codon:yes gene_type:complete